MDTGGKDGRGLKRCEVFPPHFENKKKVKSEDYMYHEKKEEEDTQTLKTALTHRYNDSKIT